MDKQKESCMCLPEGKTCNDCGHYARCKALGVIRQEPQTSCDWWPIRFKNKLPIIVCLCGSTRFSDAFCRANLEETLAGKIVLSIGCDLRSDAEVFGHLPTDELEAIKLRLVELHFRKIELADEVLILNVGGYIGYSTGRELAHARKLGKVIRFLEEGDGH